MNKSEIRTCVYLCRWWWMDLYEYAPVDVSCQLTWTSGMLSIKQRRPKRDHKEKTRPEVTSGHICSFPLQLVYPVKSHNSLVALAETEFFCHKSEAYRHHTMQITLYSDFLILLNAYHSTVGCADVLTELPRLDHQQNPKHSKIGIAWKTGVTMVHPFIRTYCAEQGPYELCV